MKMLYSFRTLFAFFNKSFLGRLAAVVLEEPIAGGTGAVSTGFGPTVSAKVGSGAREGPCSLLLTGTAGAVSDCDSASESSESSSSLASDCSSGVCSRLSLTPLALKIMGGSGGLEEL